MATGDVDGPKDDWLVEGLAEYYALELLRRTGGISQRRFDGAMEDLAQWAARENGGLAEPSTGANTAYAVLVINELAQKTQATGQSLDAVQALLQRGLSADDLLATTADLGVEMTLPELPAEAAGKRVRPMSRCYLLRAVS